AQERAIHLHHVRQIEIEHIADRLFHDGMIAPDVENAEAAQEVEIRRVIHVVEIRALGPRIDLVETDHPLHGDERAVKVALVQLVVFSEPRRHDLFQVECHEDRVADVAAKRNAAPTQVPVLFAVILSGAQRSRRTPSYIVPRGPSTSLGMTETVPAPRYNKKPQTPPGNLRPPVS